MLESLCSYRPLYGCGSMCLVGLLYILGKYLRLAEISCWLDT